MITKEILSYTVKAPDVKHQLNIEPDITNDDLYIESLIEAAADYVSGMVSGDVETTNCTLEVEGDMKVINEAPFQSLTKVTNVDTEVEVTEDCQVVVGWSGFTIRFPESAKYKVEWKSGYAILPPAIKQAIIIKAADLFDVERSSLVVGSSISNSHAIPNLIAKYRRAYW